MRIFSPIQDQGEGLEPAAAYLNQLPHSQTATASVFERNIRVFRRVYAAGTSKFMNPARQFRVYDVHSRQRNLTEVSDDWQAAWAADQDREPLFTVAFDGVTYVWVYGEIPTPPVADGITFTPNARFGDHLRLESTVVSSEVVAPGDTVTVVHYWQSDGRAAGDVKVFNHLPVCRPSPPTAVALPPKRPLSAPYYCCPLNDTPVPVALIFLGLSDFMGFGVKRDA